MMEVMTFAISKEIEFGQNLTKYLVNMLYDFKSVSSYYAWIWQN